MIGGLLITPGGKRIPQKTQRERHQREEQKGVKRLRHATSLLVRRGGVVKAVAGRINSEIAGIGDGIGIHVFVWDTVIAAAGVEAETGCESLGRDRILSVL